MKRYLKYGATFMLLAVTLISCNWFGSKDDNKDVNSYMYLYMRNYYLWNESFSSTRNIPDSSPYTFFESLLHRNDKWSTLMDEASDLIGIMTNESVSFGWGLSFYYFSDINEIWGQVLYVHKNSPAAAAGLKRGDLITRMNGKVMTDDGSATDCRQLFSASSVTVTVKENSQSVGKELSLTAGNGYMDPVIASKIITEGSHKIGYLLYSDFVERSESDLKSVFSGFKTAGVTDLILDLRYNGGGTTSTAQLLSSLIAPKECLDGKHVFSKFEFNDVYTEALRKEGELEEQTIGYFLTSAKVPQNLDLDKVYILTGKGTASASEQTIIGLKPYMDVITVGGPTYGKFVGGTIMPADVTADGKIVPYRNTPMKNWCMYIMMFWYSNANGYPGVNAGLAPTKRIEEDLESLKPVGDMTDPVLSNTINHITTGAWLPSDGTRAEGVRGEHIRTMTPGVPTGVLVKDIALPGM